MEPGWDSKQEIAESLGPVDTVRSRKEADGIKVIIILLHIMTKRHSKRNKNHKVTVRPKRKTTAPTHGAPRALDELKTQVPLFPSSVRKKLAYYEQGFELSGTAGLVGQYVFTANGLYDPNITGTGHQPMGFDTMMLYYEQYTVLNSRITVRAVGNGAQAACLSVCLAPDTTASALPGLVENGLIISRVVEARGGTSNGTGTRIVRIDLPCDVAKYFGRKSRNDLVDTTDLSGTVAANPVEQVYYLINAWTFANFADNFSVQCEVIIEYDALFWEPRKVSAMIARQTVRGLEELKDSFIAVHK